MTAENTINVALILIFLGLSGFFSSSEAAFLSIQKTRLTHLVNTNVPGAQKVADMISNTDRLLSTILLGNNLVNVAFTAIITTLCVSLLGEGVLSIIAATLVGTLLLLVLGEIIPKSVAVKSAERISLIYARPLKTVEFCLFPIVLSLQWLSNRTQSVFGPNNPPEETVTEGEILSMIDIGEAEGTVEPNEAEMLENVFRFGDSQTREVMTPRTEIISIERTATLHEFLEIYSTNSHTRFPVYRESRENIIGIISVKDVLRVLSTRGINSGDSVADIVRDAHFVPETVPVANLFEELRKAGHQMAICLDEYGGIAGLVTVKRLTEVVVGPVGEEGETPEEEYANIRPNVYQIDGGMSIDEVNSELELDLPYGEYETIAGFVLSHIGEIPKIGNEFDYSNLSFRIMEMDRLRINSILITKKLTPIHNNFQRDEEGSIGSSEKH